MGHGVLMEIEALMVPRRDAVAAILMDLYVLATALREGAECPRYLPSAAVARRRLLDRMEEVEERRKERVMVEKVGEHEQQDKRGRDDEGKTEDAEKGKGKGGQTKPDPAKGRRWAEVYQYAFSTALTDTVEELQNLQRYTKEICGEVRWEDADDIQT